MITTFFPPHHFGGDAVAVQNLSLALVRRGHDVTVICDVDAWRALADGPEPPPAEPVPGLTVHRLRSAAPLLGETLTHQIGRPTLHRRRIERIVREGAFDVLHFHNVSLIGGPGLLGIGDPGPVRLYTAHEHWLVCPTHVLWRYGREPCDARDCLRCQIAHRRPPQLWRTTGALEEACRSIDVFLAPSASCAARHAAFGFAPPMTVLPHGLPDRPAADGAAPHPRPFVLVAGRLEAIKGVEDAIAAVDLVAGVDLVVAGEGSQGEALRRRAAGRSDVHFRGQVDQQALDHLMRHALAVVAPSRVEETFGLVVAEAFRAGTPAIARRLGGLAELVEQADAGFLFDDVPGCADAIRALAGDPALRADLSARARSAWERHWSDDAVLPRYLAIIERAAS